MKTLAIVVPCYNEEETIHPFLAVSYTHLTLPTKA